MVYSNLTTGVIAQYCGVTGVTVLRWIRKGHLSAFRLPGGHYRIARDDFSNFLAEHNISISEHEFKENRGINK